MKKLTKKVSVIFISSLGLALIGALTFFTASSIDAYADEKTSAKEQAINASFLKRDVPYCNTSVKSQTMDAYLVPDMDTASPVVIYVHGGGWNQGDKQNTISNEYAKLFTGMDIAFISVDYRLSNEAAYPAQNEDVACAVDYIMSNANTWNIDSERIIIMGDSAGGQLASAEALGRKDMYDSVIIAYGVSNLWRQITNFHDKNAVGYLGAADKALADKASPQFQDLENSPPFLLIHGTADTVVPADESKNFATKLTNAGNEARYVPVANASHGFLGTRSHFDTQARQVIIGFINAKW